MKNSALLLPAVLLFAAPMLLSQAPAAATDPLAPTLGVKSADQIDREWQQALAAGNGDRDVSVVYLALTPPEKS